MVKLLKCWAPRLTVGWVMIFYKTFLTWTTSLGTITCFCFLTKHIVLFLFAILSPIDCPCYFYLCSYLDPSVRSLSGDWHITESSGPVSTTHVLHGRTFIISATYSAAINLNLCLSHSFPHFFPLCTWLFWSQLQKQIIHEVLNNLILICFNTVYLQLISSIWNCLIFFSWSLALSF